MSARSRKLVSIWNTTEIEAQGGRHPNPKENWTLTWGPIRGLTCTRSSGWDLPGPNHSQFSTALYQVAGNRGVGYQDVCQCYVDFFFRGRESHSPCSSGSMWNDLWALMRSLFSFFSFLFCLLVTTNPIWGGCERQSFSVNVTAFNAKN